MCLVTKSTLKKDSGYHGLCYSLSEITDFVYLLWDQMILFFVSYSFALFYVKAGLITVKTYQVFCNNVA